MKIYTGKKMIVDCISDLHGFFPKLEGGDLLIVAGDLTSRDLKHERHMFLQWLADQKYRKKVWIAGNHDNSLVGMKFNSTRPDSAEYLCDSGTEFEGLKIWGSPWTSAFIGMNPHCMAFTIPFNNETEHWLSWQWRLIPKDTDILITHSPPYGILDGIPNEDGSLFHVGSKSLAKKVGHMENPPKLWVWGHIHEAYGRDLAVRGKPCIMVNASHVNEHYKPVNKPIRIEL